METLLIQFPGRQYHATPWGQHVNEGLIEWPPSPWRLLRALIATGYNTGLWEGARPSPVACSLVQKMAGVLPSYRLPPCVGTHCRHYMPLARFKNAREEMTLVFDTWAQLDDGVLAVTWDIELSPEESSLLSNLAERLGYLGRSESWTTARLAKLSETLPDGFQCYPSETSPGHGWEQVLLLAAQDEQGYAEWRQTALAHALSAFPEVDSSKKKLTKEEKHILLQRDKAEALYPPDLVSCLQVDTVWLQQHGWSQPPGTRRVQYCRSVDALQVSTPRLYRANSTAPTIDAALLSIISAKGSDSALPSIVRTLPQAELLHRALVSYLTRRGSGFSAALMGRDEERRPLLGPHDHAHILPLDLDGDDHLDHILISAKMGLDAVAQEGVRAVRQTYTKGGIGPLRLALAVSGSLDDLRVLTGKYGEGLKRVLGFPGGSPRWRSITPFVPPRYIKKRGRNTLEGQIIAELTSRGVQKPIDVRLIDPEKNEWVRRLRHFVRTRRQGPEPPIDCGFAVELDFAQPVSGPLCLGYGSHFGLGLFGVNH